MRGPRGDEGLAVKACREGRLSEEILEPGVSTIQATAFGEIICGHGTNDFCVVCGTYTTSAGTRGARRCVRIVNNNPPVSASPGLCGPFNVIPDTTGMCTSETGELGQTFSSPEIGFFVDIDASTAGDEGGKDLVLCAGRSWQCINTPQANATAVQGAAGDAIIDTPACFVKSGRTYCYK